MRAGYGKGSVRGNKGNLAHLGKTATKVGTETIQDEICQGERELEGNDGVGKDQGGEYREQGTICPLNHKLLDTEAVSDIGIFEGEGVRPVGNIESRNNSVMTVIDGNKTGEASRTSELGTVPFLAVEIPKPGLVGDSELHMCDIQVEEDYVRPQEELRDPLRDCTNQLQLEQHNVLLSRKSGHKGHWKRQARLQGQRDHCMDVTNVKSQQYTVRKRERSEDERESVRVNRICPDKRSKPELIPLEGHNLEVGETSLKWSQPIR